MLAFYGMMLRETNIKLAALTALAALPGRDRVSEGMIQLSQSWLFHDTGIFINAAHYALWFCVIYPLLFWKAGSRRLNQRKALTFRAKSPTCALSVVRALGRARPCWTPRLSQSGDAGPIAPTPTRVSVRASSEAARASETE